VANARIWRKKATGLPVGAGADLLAPAFYTTRQLGERPAELVRDIIGGDERFFAPVAE